MTTTKVTFDADEDDLTESDADDETTTLFQSALIADTDSEGIDSDNDMAAPHRNNNIPPHKKRTPIPTLLKKTKNTRRN